jgi:hypothetical protein
MLEAGRSAPRFVGTTLPELATLCKALTRCTKRSSTLVVYEAGPRGYGLGPTLVRRVG